MHSVVEIYAGLLLEIGHLQSLHTLNMGMYENNREGILATPQWSLFPLAPHRKRMSAYQIEEFTKYIFDVDFQSLY